MLRRSRFDLVIDFRGDFASLLVAYMCGATYSVGYNIRGKGILLTVKLKVQKNKHEIERCLDVVRAIGANTKNRNPILIISDEDRSFAQNFLELNGISKKDLVIGIHPGAPFPPRRWPKERFAQVADELMKRHKAKIIFFGSPDEVWLTNEIIGLMKEKPINAAGKTTIKKLAALIRKCDLFIGNDSSPMHIAAAMKVPVIALFGPGEYPRFAPYGEGHVVIRKVLKCSPCEQYMYGDKCKRGIAYCMNAITVQEVMRAAEKLIKKLNKNRGRAWNS